MSEPSAQKTVSEEAGPTGQSIRDLIERAFLVGVGAAALTKDRVQELVEELVHRGHLTGDEGKELADKLVTRSRDEARAAMKKADSSLQGAYRDMGLATRRDIEDFDFRLRQIEHRVQLLEGSVDSTASQGESPAEP